MMKQKTFSIAAMLLVGFIIFQFIFSWILQIRSQQMGAYQLANRFSIAAGAIGHLDLSPLPNEPPYIGEAIALIKIPKLRMEQIIFEGSDSNTTKKGIGHVPGTSGISETGTSILVGRKSTWGSTFYKIDKLKVGDIFFITNVSGTKKYKISDIGLKNEHLTDLKETRILLVTSSSILALNDYIIEAKMQGAPFISTPQNRMRIEGFRMGSLSSTNIILYFLLVFGYCFAHIRMLEIFDKVVVWTISFPIFLLLTSLLYNEITNLLPPTL